MRTGRRVAESRRTRQGCGGSRSSEAPGGRPVLRAKVQVSWRSLWVPGRCEAGSQLTQCPGVTGQNPERPLEGLLSPPDVLIPDVRSFRCLVGLKEASLNGPVSPEGTPATGPAPGAVLPRYTRALLGQGGGGVGSSPQATDVTPLPGLSTLPPPTSKLKEEDFPSLCASTSSSSSSCSAVAAPGPVGLGLTYPVPARGRSTFQEDDFPALVSSASKPSTAPTSLISAWNGSGSKKVAHPTTGAPAASGSSQPARKAGKGGKGSKKAGPPPSEEEEEDGRTGLTAQELRSVPTTVAVSSLLALASTQTLTKVGKKKKVGSEKPGAISPPPLPPDKDGPLGAEQTPTTSAGRAEGPVALIVNGHTEGPAPVRSTPKEPPGLPRPLGPLPCPTPQEDFPALGVPCPPRMPPPPGMCVCLRPASGYLEGGQGWEHTVRGGDRLAGRGGKPSSTTDHERAACPPCEMGQPWHFLELGEEVAPARDCQAGAQHVCCLLALSGLGPAVRRRVACGRSLTLVGRAAREASRARGERVTIWVLVHLPYRLQCCGAPEGHSAPTSPWPGALHQQATPWLLRPPAWLPPSLCPQHCHHHESVSRGGPPHLVPLEAGECPHPGPPQRAKAPPPACFLTLRPRLTAAPQAYLVPENFRERNLQLIQSIRDFLQSDEARFGKFKSHSGEFRQVSQAGVWGANAVTVGAQPSLGMTGFGSGWQGVISAAQYYKSCRDLLGENFQKIFNELLVLLPDTAKQQELLSAHTHFRGRERPPGTKAKKNKKSAWQGSARPAGLDCCVCPTCQQVLAHGDVSSHQALHAAQDHDFPSLQAIARILT